MGNFYERSNSQGRPRSDEVNKQILDTALIILSEVGIEKLSIASISQRSGVAKSSIYRRWNNKEELIVAALENIKTEMNINLDENKNLEQLLLELSSDAANNLNNPLGKQMLSLMLSTVSNNSTISKAYWEKHTLPKTKEISELIKQREEKENLKENLDYDLVSEIMIGFIIYQLLLKPSSLNLDNSLSNAMNILINGIKDR